MDVTVLDEPLIEFGYGGTHQEQRAGLRQHGPADIEMDDRHTAIRIGIVGRPNDITDVEAYLKHCAKGLPAKGSPLPALFPDFPGCSATMGFHAKLKFPSDGRRGLTRAALSPVGDAETEADRLSAAVKVCGDQVRAMTERAELDVIVVARPPGIPDGVVAGAGTGADFQTC